MAEETPKETPAPKKDEGESAKDGQDQFLNWFLAKSRR